MFHFFKKKEEKKEDVYIENDLGKFLVTTFGKTTPMLEGKIDWPDRQNDVEACIICSSEDENVQARNLDYLRQMLANKEELDEKLKDFIVNDQMNEAGLVPIWGEVDAEEEPDPISGEEFRKMLHLSYIRIYEDTTAEFVFPADKMFTDHDLVVWADSNLKLMECLLEG